MNKIKLWWRNLRWLFNHPPIAFTMTKPEDMKNCDYCPNAAAWQLGDKLNICYECLKKAFDVILRQ